MPLTENQIRLTARGTCLWKDNDVPAKATNWSGFEHEPPIKYFILGFDLNMPSDPKSLRDIDSRARVLQKICFCFFVFALFCFVLCFFLFFDSS